ncbi:hypothetical protein BROUX41_000556 [Berkeleyomyces rouxiae]|uniref:uncharacterized protein n=1 Tax=Berkeleyomyces rouxiae TaxID=2035830 RepID=UPI003B7CB99C
MANNTGSPLNNFEDMRKEISSIPQIFPPPQSIVMATSVPSPTHENYRQWLQTLNHTLMHNSLPVVNVRPGPRFAEGCAPCGVTDSRLYHTVLSTLNNTQKLTFASESSERLMQKLEDYFSKFDRAVEEHLKTQLTSINPVPKFSNIWANINCVRAQLQYYDPLADKIHNDKELLRRISLVIDPVRYDHAIQYVRSTPYASAEDILDKFITDEFRNVPSRHGAPSSHVAKTPAPTVAANSAVETRSAKGQRRRPNHNRDAERQYPPCSTCDDYHHPNSRCNESLTPTTGKSRWSLKTTRPVVVKTASSNLKANQVGNTTVRSSDRDNKPLQLPLKDVLIVPQITENLISVSTLCQSGHKVTFDDKQVVVTDKDDQVRLTGQHNPADNLYEVDETASRNNKIAVLNAVTEEQELEHGRLGHFLRESKMTMDDCDACTLTKMTDKRNKYSKPACEPLQLVSADIMGPFPPSLNNGRYALVIVDSATRMHWIYELKERSEARDSLNRWRTQAELQSGHKLKAIRCDNARELVSTTLEWNQEYSIDNQHTVPHHSSQNGLAERANRTIQEAGNAMLTWSKLPNEFWFMAMAAATHTYNTFSPPHDRSKSRYQAFTDKPTDTKHLRVFGCKAFSLMEYESLPTGTKHKNMHHAREVVFVGYSDHTDKHFLVWAPDRQHVIKAHKVSFRQEIPAGDTVHLNLPTRNTGLGSSNTPPARRPVGRPRKENSAPKPTTNEPENEPPAPIPIEKGSSLEELIVERIENSTRNENVELGSATTDKMKSEAEKDNSTSSDTIVTERPADEDMQPQQEVMLEDIPNLKPEERGELPDPIDPGTTTTVEEIGEPTQQINPATLSRPDTSDNGPTYQTNPIISQKRTINDTEITPPTSPHHKKVNLGPIDIEFVLTANASAITMAIPNYPVEVPQPKNYWEAVNDSKWGPFWVEANERELTQLIANCTWDVVPHPGKNSNILTSTWAYKTKHNPDHTIALFKSRLCAHGFKQLEGIDFFETFAPTVNMATLRFCLSLVAQTGLECQHFDINNAFTEADLHETIYMHPPPGLRNIPKGQVLKLNKAIYGLKQASREWYNTASEYFRSVGFVISEVDPCLFYNPDKQLIVLLYVDDILVIGKTAAIDWYHMKLNNRFKFKHLGPVSRFLGMVVRRDQEKRTLTISQQPYVEEILHDYDFIDNRRRPVNSPVTEECDLRPRQDHEALCDVTEYQKLMGKLNYLATMTRPDIAFAVSKHCQFMHAPTDRHMSSAKHILRYLRSHPARALTYGTPSEQGPRLLGYSDANFGAEWDERYSTTGYIFMSAGAPISWKSKRQKCLTTSTTNAEFIALSQAAKESEYLAKIARFLHAPTLLPDTYEQTVRSRGQESTQLIYGDNQGANALANGGQSLGRIRHIEMHYLFVREQCSRNKLRVEYIPTGRMLADGLTKPLTGQAFEDFTEGLTMLARGV